MCAKIFDGSDTMENTLLWLWLQYGACITRAKQHKLINHFGDIESIYKSDALAYRDCSFLDEENIARLCNKDLSVGRDMISALSKISASAVTRDDKNYPSLLSEIHTAPNILFCRGSFYDFNSLPHIAMVGTRKATSYGQTTAYNLARSLSQNGIVVVSGMAMGIDTKCHEGALSGGTPTVAVLGTGVDCAYPRSNARLMTQIMQNGAVISEYPIASRAERYHFPERNRIISGISLGTIVVEADVKSGSLITAQYASEQNRDVFAVPGNINASLSKGSNFLLKDGAHMVTGAKDILDYYSLNFTEEQKTSQPVQKTASTPEERILCAIGEEVVHIDIICQKSGLNAGTVNASLLMLELGGKVLRHSGGYYSQIKSL